MLTLGSWNVLHRVHAENWKEPSIQSWPDEAGRVQRIAEAVVERVERGCEAVCLQEVSGDQLQALRTRLPADARLFDFRYPRVPARKGLFASVPPARLVDEGEYLVVLVKGPRAAGAQLAEARAFSSDRGKGFLAVRLEAGLSVVSTHVTFKKAAAQLAELRGVLEPVLSTGAVVLAGDFNADRAAVGKALGPSWRLGLLTPEGVTTHGSGAKAANIDHVAAMRGEVFEAHVEEVVGTALSDHRWLQARVKLGA